MSGSLQLWGWSVCSQQELEKLHYDCETFPVYEPEACSSIWLLPTQGAMSRHPKITLNMAKTEYTCIHHQSSTSYQTMREITFILLLLIHVTISHILGTQRCLVYTQKSGNTNQQFRASLKRLQDPWYTEGLIASYSSSLQVTGVEAI